MDEEDEYKPVIKNAETSQTPEIPWDQWFDRLRERFEYWGQEEPQEVKEDEFPGLPVLPYLPEEYKRIGLPLSYFDHIAEQNKKIREIRGENSQDIFYRPGLGATNVTEEILDKIGAYKTMIVTDPVYAEKEMIDWSEGILPIDFYVRSLNVIGAKDMKILLANDYKVPGRNVDLEEYRSLEIPKGGMAEINCRINGVNLSFRLLTEDMTKLDLRGFQILSLGQPTPFHKNDQSAEEEIYDPRGNNDFQIRAIENLSIGGVICYDRGFEYFPKSIPLEAFGFSEVSSKDGRMIVQKKEDVSDKLAKVFQIPEIIGDIVFVLSARHPKLTWAYYKDVSPEYQVAIEDILDAYKEKLEKISDLTNSISDKNIQLKIIKRVEFLLMNPIASNRVLDEGKVKKIVKAPEDPDNPEEKKGFGPYFGSPRGLIEDHNAGNINIWEYYKKIIDEFYAKFPQLKQLKII